VISHENVHSMKDLTFCPFAIWIFSEVVWHVVHGTGGYFNRRL